MNKIFFVFFILATINCRGQVTVSGRVLSQADTKPLPNASVFLNNTSAGNNTAADGTFALHGVKPGKYDLIISIIGFETYSQPITVTNSNIVLPDLLIFPKTIQLNEVKVKPKTDPDRERNYEWFKREFLGTSELSSACKILNPEILDLDYDEKNNKLTASAPAFLEIENDALGYRIKFLLKNFLLENKDKPDEKVYYKGPVLFEELSGTPFEKRRYKKNRAMVYENSPMHFLRSALSNTIDKEGFRVQQLAIYANPGRPADSLITARLKFYQAFKTRDKIQRDSLSFWVKKSKLPKTLQKLMPFALNGNDMIRPTDQPGQYSLGCENDGLYVAYSKNHHYNIDETFNNFSAPVNTGNTLIQFNSPYAFFYNNGVITNPYSMLFYGAWGKNRVAELLPIDYGLTGNETHNVENDIAKKITDKLEDYSSAYISENAYLQFDKPYYAAGDTIYFKAYITKGGRHVLSDISGVLHVDLINTQNKIDRSIKLQLDSGISWGDFALPDSLPKGNYRVRAYTRWMLNNNEAGFFDKVIPVGAATGAPVAENLTKLQYLSLNNKPDIQFFPEGGTLVTGVRSKVAFKAVGADGKGVDVKGTVIDQNHKEVCKLASIHLGMGCFYITPAAGEAYKAVITYANGLTDEAGLPTPEASGIVLSVNNDSIPKAALKIEANAAYYRENRGKPFAVLVYSGETATTVTCNLDSPVIKMDILKRKLHTGISTLTLFSQAGEPLCERLLFIQNYNFLDLSLNSDKPDYTKREKVNISLNVKDRSGKPAEGHFSVSVTDESKVPVDENAENTILTNLLLTSWLKGYIEQPNYYFANINDKTLSDLDLVMLTHGYRRFEWKQLLNGTYPPIAFQPENKLQITGTAKSLSGKPLAKAAVSLIAMNGGNFMMDTTDNQGRFRFSNLVFLDSARFMLQAVNAKGKNDTKLFYDKELPGPVVNLAMPTLFSYTSEVMMTAYMENNSKKRQEAAKYGAIKGKLLKEVIIKGKKPDEPNLSNNLVSPEFADQVIHADQLAKGGFLSDRLQGVLHGIHIQKGGAPGAGAYAYLIGSYPSNPMLVILDGAPTDGDLDKISGIEIESIEVLRFASAAAYGSKGGNGVLVINSTHKLGLQPEDMVAEGVLPVSPKGFYKSRTFYSPKYDNNTQTNSRVDLRTTIYWQPEIKTGKDGNASFVYYNADGKGTYRVTIEGIDSNGNIGRAVFRYNVQ